MSSHLAKSKLAAPASAYLKSERPLLCPNFGPLPVDPPIDLRWRSPCALTPKRCPLRSAPSERSGRPGGVEMPRANQAVERCRTRARAPPCKRRSPDRQGTPRPRSCRPRMRAARSLAPGRARRLRLAAPPQHHQPRTRRPRPVGPAAQAHVRSIVFAFAAVATPLAPGCAPVPAARADIRGLCKLCRILGGSNLVECA